MFVTRTACCPVRACGLRLIDVEPEHGGRWECPDGHAPAACDFCGEHVDVVDLGLARGEWLCRECRQYACDGCGAPGYEDLCDGCTAKTGQCDACGRYVPTALLRSIASPHGEGAFCDRCTCGACRELRDHGGLAWHRPCEHMTAGAA